jgi:hypothetical protein
MITWFKRSFKNSDVILLGKIKYANRKFAEYANKYNTSTKKQ